MSCEAAYDVSCVANEFASGGLIERAAFVCGPLPGSTQAQCCYVLTGDSAIGRPFLVAGRARKAHARPGAGWTKPVHPDVRGLDERTRHALADVYLREGLSEHASVASFARFALQCLACAAPAELVRGAQQAALDEVAHAELAFGLARAYAETEFRPGRLDVHAALDQSLTLHAVAESVAREGAIAETVSALILAAARDAAEDPAVKGVLERVAADEMQHALLAWKYLRWALESGDDALREALRTVFAHASLHVGFGSVTELAGDTEAMRAHGYLSLDERRRIAAHALTNVIAPAARALLAARPASARARSLDC